MMVVVIPLGVPHFEMIIFSAKAEVKFAFNTVVFTFLKFWFGYFTVNADIFYLSDL